MLHRKAQPGSKESGTANQGTDGPLGTGHLPGLGVGDVL